MSTWWPDDAPRLDAEEARAALLRRWLGAFGPATVADTAWWSGLTQGQARKALALIGVEEVDLDGASGVVLADDLEPLAIEDEPWVALLPSLDPTTMGWKERRWYLADHGGALFDSNGNAGPTVWSDGRIVGGWSQRSSGEVVFEMLEDVGAWVLDAVAQEAARLSDWLGEIRIKPRFPTPLQRRLAI